MHFKIIRVFGLALYTINDTRITKEYLMNDILSKFKNTTNTKIFIAFINIIFFTIVKKIKN